MADLVPAGLLGPVGVHRRRAGEAVQHLAPLGFRRLPVLSFEPGDVRAEGRRVVELRALARAQGGVGRRELVEEHRQAPAVEQQLVEAPHQPPRRLALAQQPDPGQRSPRQIEAATAIRLEIALETSLPLALLELPPVVDLDGDLGALVDQLQRAIEVLPVEGRAQHRLASHQELPGRPEGGFVEAILETGHHLRDLVARLRVVEAVEEHALLHRRQRIEIREVRMRREQRVELRLSHRRQRYVGGRHATGGGRQAMLDETLEMRLEGAHQGRHPRRFVKGLAIAEGDLQATPREARLDVEQVGAQGIGAGRRTDGA